MGFTVASLSSRDVHVRQAGYHVLSRYMMHLEGARFKERKQVSAGHSIMCEGKRDRQSVSQTEIWTDKQTGSETDRNRDSQVQIVR